MFFWVIALASFYKSWFCWKKNTSKNKQTLTLENRILEPRKSCFEPQGRSSVARPKFWGGANLLTLSKQQHDEL